MSTTESEVLMLTGIERFDVAKTFEEWGTPSESRSHCEDIFRLDLQFEGQNLGISHDITVEAFNETVKALYQNVNLRERIEAADETSLYGSLHQTEPKFFRENELDLILTEFANLKRKKSVSLDEKLSEIEVSTAFREKVLKLLIAYSEPRWADFLAEFPQIFDALAQTTGQCFLASRYSFITETICLTENNQNSIDSRGLARNSLAITKDSDCIRMRLTSHHKNLPFVTCLQQEILTLKEDDSVVFFPFDPQTKTFSGYGRQLGFVRLAKLKKDSIANFNANMAQLQNAQKYYLMEINGLKDYSIRRPEVFSRPSPRSLLATPLALSGLAGSVAAGVALVIILVFAVSPPLGLGLAAAVLIAAGLGALLGWAAGKLINKYRVSQYKKRGSSALKAEKEKVVDVTKSVIPHSKNERLVSPSLEKKQELLSIDLDSALASSSNTQASSPVVSVTPIADAMMEKKSRETISTLDSHM